MADLGTEEPKCLLLLREAMEPAINEISTHLSFVDYMRKVAGPFMLIRFLLLPVHPPSPFPRTG